MENLDRLALLNGVSREAFLDALQTEFIGPRAKWFKARFAIPGKHWHWPSLFLSVGWYGWRKMYFKSASSGFSFGFGIPLAILAETLLFYWLGRPHSPIGLWVAVILIWAAYDFSMSSVDEYKQFVLKNVHRIVEASSTPEQALNEAHIKGSTNLVGVFIPVIPFIVGCLLGFAVLGALGNVPLIKRAFDATHGDMNAGNNAPVGTWSLTAMDGPSPGEEYHLLSADQGKTGGVDLIIRAQCTTEGIQPAPVLALVALTDVPINSISFRRHNSSQPEEASDYIVGDQNQSRVIYQMRPIDTMNAEELSKQFGIAALFSLGVQLFDQDGSLDKAAADYQEFITSYYDKIFSNDALLVQVNFKDINGGAQTVSRTVDVSGLVDNRDAFLSACGLKDPYRS